MTKLVLETVEGVDKKPDEIFKLQGSFEKDEKLIKGMVKNMFNYAQDRAIRFGLQCRLEMILVTMGSHGVLVYNGDDFKHFNGKNLGKFEVKSVVGAGDSFLGGFVSGLYLDKPVSDSIEIGQLCAEMTLRSDKNVSEGITSSLLQF